MEYEAKSLKNYHKLGKCCECNNWRREDNLKRHSKKHKIFDEIKDSKENNNDLDTELRLKKKIDDLDQELIFDNKLYLEKLERGEQIFNRLSEGLIMEDSLSKQNKEALDVFRKSYNPLSVTDIVLKPWQKELLSKMKPTDREVIWVRGKDGCEGKTWFQKYVQSQYGYSRVAQLELKNKTKNMLHVLRKFQLSTVDIFLFNDSRSISMESYCYSVLENIKDGCATAMKYDSERIKFKTPNIVIVFSNHSPNMKQLSEDRWIVYYIQDGVLLPKVEKYVGNKKITNNNQNDGSCSESD